MNGKQSKKLRALSSLFYQSQPPNMQGKKSLSEIYQQLKVIHKNKVNGKSNQTKA